MFGKKKQIANLDAKNASLSDQLLEQIKDNGALRNQVEYLVRTIRDMDQEIWNMAQRTDWNGMRPHFVKLQDGMTARKHAENSRINDILRGELINTYRPNDAPKKITKA